MIQYSDEDLIALSVKAIEKHNLFFIEDLVAYLPISKGTFYHRKLNESDEIKDTMLRVKTSVKVSMRAKWWKSDNATLQISLYKLIASEEERKKLSQGYMEHSGGIKHTANIDPKKLKDETLRDLFENGLMEGADEGAE